MPTPDWKTLAREMRDILNAEKNPNWMEAKIIDIAHVVACLCEAKANEAGPEATPREPLE